MQSSMMLGWKSVCLFLLIPTLINHCHLVYQVNWLRAKAWSNQWSKELQIVRHDMSTSPGKKIIILARYCLKKNCNFLRCTWDQVFLQHHDLFTMSQLWLSQMTSWFLQVHQWSAPCMHHDLCRSTNTQHPACIMIFSGAPMVSALHASWFFQKHQWSASCMHHDLCRCTNGQCSDAS